VPNTNPVCQQWPAFQRCFLPPSSGHYPETSNSFYQTYTAHNAPEDKASSVLQIKGIVVNVIIDRATGCGYH
jgi:hypothetical protein